MIPFLASHTSIQITNRPNTRIHNDNRNSNEVNGLRTGALLSIVSGVSVASGAEFVIVGGCDSTLIESLPAWLLAKATFDAIANKSKIIYFFMIGFKRLNIKKI
jgi:hypothetical protein